MPPLGVLLELCHTFLLIGAGAFGGGIAALSLIVHEIVGVHGWLSAEQMNEVIAIAQLTPGPIAVNAATFVGYQLAGFLGAVAATVSVLVPPLLVLSIFVLLIKIHSRVTDSDTGGRVGRRLKNSLRPGVFAMILYAVWSVGESAIIGIRPAIIAIVGFGLLLLLRRLHPVVMVLGAGLAGIFVL